MMNSNSEEVKHYETMQVIAVRNAQRNKTKSQRQEMREEETRQKQKQQETYEKEEEAKE